MKAPPFEAGTKWFDKLTILSKVEGPMGFPKGRSGSSPLWSNAGSKPRVRYNLIALALHKKEDGSTFVGLRLVF